MKVVVMEKIAKLFPIYLMNPETAKLFTVKTFVIYGNCGFWKKKDALICLLALFSVKKGANS